MIKYISSEDLASVLGSLDLVPALDYVVSGDLVDIEHGTPLPQLLSLH